MEEEETSNQILPGEVGLEGEEGVEVVERNVVGRGRGDTEDGAGEVLYLSTERVMFNSVERTREPTKNTSGVALKSS